MGDKMTRRDLGAKLLALAATAALPNTAEAQQVPIQYLESSLSPAEIEKHKSRAADKLRASIPTNQGLRYLHDHARYLEHESQMYIPNKEERDLVLAKSKDAQGRSQIDMLVQRLAPDETGLYLFADVDDAGKHFHRLYVLRNNNDVRFEKAYRVGMSEKGFGDALHETPLGLMRILSGEIGAYAEVVRAERRNNDANVIGELNRFFNQIRENGITRWFARTFGEPPSEAASDRERRDRAEVVTARYTINEQRGVHFHGTNRSGFWDNSLGRWVTFLGGRRRSSGCIRMSNTDIYDLGLSGFATLPQRTGQNRREGTWVMIHATAQARRDVQRIPNEHGSDFPQRRPLPEDLNPQPVPKKAVPQPPAQQDMPANLPIQPAPPAPTPKRFSPPPRRLLPEDLPPQ